jgi:hypothetical protein
MTRSTFQAELNIQFMVTLHPMLIASPGRSPHALVRLDSKETVLGINATFDLRFERSAMPNPRTPC